ncbi:MAG: lectin-like protein [Oscillospiraceae bacterium]|jgi:hypothetical protein
MPLKHIFDTTGPIAGRLGDITKDEAVRLGIALCFAAGRMPEAEHGHGEIWPGVIRIGPEETVTIDPAHPNVEPSANELEYASPEHFWNGICSPAGDVYSIGLVLYAALNNGRLPFIPMDGEITADDRAEALKQRMKGDNPIFFPSSIDASLCDILRRALAFNPKDRWETPMAMRDALCNCAADVAAGILLPGTGATLFGKKESDMSEVERMMSEILDRQTADNTAAPVSAAEVLQTPESSESEDTDENAVSEHKESAEPETISETQSEEKADANAEDADHAISTPSERSDASDASSEIEEAEGQGVCSSQPDSEELPDSSSISEETSAPSESQNSKERDLPDHPDTLSGLTGLAALAEEIDGQVMPSSAAPHEEANQSDHIAELEGIDGDEAIPGSTQEELATDVDIPKPEEAPVQEEHGTPSASEETDPTDKTGATSENETEALADAALTNLNTPEENGTHSTLPLDKMMDQVDSHLDALSNSLFDQPDPAAVAEETARRIRIAEAAEAQEKAVKRKKRKRRASITAILLMLAAALGAILLLAHSFGFDGFSFSEIGDAFYDTVFSKIFSDKKDGEDTGDNSDTSKETPKDDDDGAQEPPIAEEQQKPDNDDTTDQKSDNTGTDTPDPANPDTTEPSNSTSNTGNDNITPPSNSTNTNSNVTTPDSDNNTSTDSGTANGGTSGSGSSVSNSNLGSSTSTYETMLSDCTWQQADFVAKEFGGHMVTISNEEELQQVIALAEEAGASYVWLGAYRNTAGKWVWITGEAFTYAPWQSGEPSGTGTNGEAENYLILCKVVDNGTTSWVYRDICNNPLSASSQTYSGKMIYIIEYN